MSRFREPGRLGFESPLLTTAEAAQYFRFSATTFRAKVKAGKLPGPIPGTNNRWDRRVLDQHMAGVSAVEFDPIMEMIRDGKV